MTITRGYRTARLHLHAAAQRGEQKRSTVQWRSALSTALSSAIVRAMTAGGANAGPEGALTAIPPSFLARNGGSKYRLFTVPLTPPTFGRQNAKERGGDTLITYQLSLNPILVNGVHRPSGVETDLSHEVLY